MNKDFLSTIHDLTNCNVTVRGQHFEPNKKVPNGQKKLYLHIEGDSKHYVTSAYKEIKRIIEEAALKNLTIGGQPGRFKI
jgi:ATP-dependent RNA helicase DDX46/PRP5